MCSGPEEGRWVRCGYGEWGERRSRVDEARLFRRGVLGDSLGALRHGVLGELTGQEQTHSGLDLARRDRRALVVVRQAVDIFNVLIEVQCA